VLAGTVAADPVQRRMPSGDEGAQCRWLDGIGSDGWSGWSSLKIIAITVLGILSVLGRSRR